MDTAAAGEPASASTTAAMRQGDGGGGGGGDDRHGDDRHDDAGQHDGGDRHDDAGRHEDNDDAIPSSSLSDQSRPHALINYVGVVTAWLGPYVVQIDGEWLLFLTHVAKQSRFGVRMGAQVLISAAHTLHVPADDVDGAGSIWLQQLDSDGLDLL